MVAEDFEPRPNDGEVALFELWDSPTLIEEVANGDQLRPAMRLVVTDFLIRHGILTHPGNHTKKDHDAIQAALHRERLVFWKENCMQKI